MAAPKRWPAAVSFSAILPSALATACLFGGLEPPDEPPLVTGTITWVGIHEGYGLRVLVEEQPGMWDDYAGEKVFFHFAKDDPDILVRQADGSWRKGGTEELQVGAVANAWHDKTYIIFDTYPRQAVASHIAILEPPAP